MFENPFITTNIIPLVYFVLTCVFVNSLYSNQKVLSIFRTNGQIHPKEPFSCSNLIKSISCLVTFLVLLYYYLTDITNGYYPNTAIRSIAMAYMAVDFMCLVRVKKYLTKSVIQHHYSIIFLVILAMCVDFNASNIGQLGLFFLFIVTATFPVNLYFALKPYRNVDWLLPIAKYDYLFTMIGYLIYLIFNWQYSIWGIFYLAATTPLFIADAKQLRHLFQEKLGKELL
jgi:hypothetical protein